VGCEDNFLGRKMESSRPDPVEMVDFTIRTPPVPTLSPFSSPDLSSFAQSAPPVIGREDHGTSGQLSQDLHEREGVNGDRREAGDAVEKENDKQSNGPSRLFRPPQHLKMRGGPFDNDRLRSTSSLQSFVDVYNSVQDEDDEDDDSVFVEKDDDDDDTMEERAIYYFSWVFFICGKGIRKFWKATPQCMFKTRSLLQSTS
tara:strand:- start:352 stop:951 length:600 start_codon:yes stop_codon:yes gene_type:complete